jgi:hypothetical protein
MSHSSDNKDHFGLLDLRVNTQYGIIVVYIMAKSTLHHVFSISSNANMPYKLKLIVMMQPSVAMRNKNDDIMHT